jgi:endonuclease III
MAIEHTGVDARPLSSAQKAERIHAALEHVYGPLEWQPRTDPLSELILTILSQHTSDTNRDRAFNTMRERFSTWEEVRDAPTQDLADAIKSGGLSNVKAPRIQEVLRQLGEERGGNLNLDFLTHMSVEEAKTYLARFHGVGPKTAACVLMFACGMPVMPVDTHVHRVSGRLGLIGPRTNAEQAHDDLEAIVQPDKRYSFHIYLIWHGRQVCKAQRPLCEICPITTWCDYYARTTGSYQPEEE